MKSFLRLAVLLACIQLTAQNTAWSEDLITTPEKSNYQKTSTYSEVMDFIKAIQGKSRYSNHDEPCHRHLILKSEKFF